MSEGKIVAVTDGATGWLIFSNPERLNAVSYEMWRAIPERIAEFVGDPAIRVVVLRGEGDKAFVSGADISQFEKVRSSEAGIADYNDATGLANEAILACPKPTIAMIQGYCIGGGLGVALCCDLRLAAANSRFAIPAARLGLGYAYGGIKRLVDVVGPSFVRQGDFLHGAAILGGRGCFDGTHQSHVFGRGSAYGRQRRIDADRTECTANHRGCETCNRCGARR